MISSTLRIVLIIGVIAYFVMILMFLKHKALALRYTLLWMVAGIALGVMVIWPSMLTHFIRMLGIASDMNGLLVNSKRLWEVIAKCFSLKLNPPK